MAEGEIIKNIKVNTFDTKFNVNKPQRDHFKAVKDMKTLRLKRKKGEVAVLYQVTLELFAEVEYEISVRGETGAGLGEVTSTKASIPAGGKSSSRAALSSPSGKS